jgi:predicted Rossmann fold nucleotide-binding protein DprA/Smf involved in DNA uptake
MTPDAQAIVLACSSLGAPREWSVKPFGPRGWADLKVDAPGGLLGLTATEIEGVGIDGPSAHRLATLLSRSAQLAFELDRLQSRGIWVTTLADESYPARVRDRLGRDAPPVLFGAGDGGLLARGGIAVVGSREVDDEAVAFTERLARAAAVSGEQVVSGGARGVDQAAMRAAFERGGTVAAALPEGIERRIRDVATRTAVADGQAVLVSPYHPAAGFSAGAAMARNKLIYALADVAVVVSSSEGSGGTWQGAIEAVAAGSVPVLVRDGPNVPEGNRRLIERGGLPLREEAINDSMSVSELVSAAEPSSRVAEDTRSEFEQQSLSLTD